MTTLPPAFARFSGETPAADPRLPDAFARFSRPVTQGTEPEKGAVAPTGGVIPTGGDGLHQLPEPPAPPRPKKPAGQQLIEGTADAIDLIWVGFLAPTLSATGEAVTRVQGSLNSALGIGDKKTRKQVSAEAEETRNRLNKQYGQPARDVLTSLGLIPPGEGFISEKVMGPAMAKVDAWGQRLEAQSGGAILKEDVNATVNTLFGALGAKGVQLTAKHAVDRQKAKYIAAELERIAKAEAGNAAEALIKEEASAATAQRLESAIAPQARQAAAQQRTDLRARIADEPPLTRPAPRPVPDVAPARYRAPTAETDALAARMTEGFEPTPITPQPRSSRISYNAATDPPGGLDLGTIRTELERKAAAAPTVAGLGDQTTMVASNRRPDMLLPAAAATAGIGAFLALDDDEKALAAAGFAGFLPQGRGRSALDATMKLPATAPLSSFLAQERYTFSTLEKLPQGRFEFNLQQIRDLLKRQEVTAMERKVFDDALQGLPEAGTITAKDLMARLQRVTGDFELTARKSDEYAGYGLNSIGRIPARDGDFSHQLVIDGEVPTAGQVTRIYQSPLDLGTGNHFGDPNYFAHTRSFEEGGVRHVVEVQSDLGQKLKGLTPEQIAEHTRLFSDAQRRLAEYRGWRRHAESRSKEIGAGPAHAELGERLRADPQFAPDFRQGQNNYAYMLNRAIQNLSVALEEHRTALSGDRNAASVGPMLKHWPRRIIREEIADAARSGETRIRFADADTVAKVEGWPRRHPDRIAIMEHNLDAARLEGDPTIIRRHEEALAAQRQALAEYPGEFSPQHQSIYDRYAGDITKFLKQLGARHIKDDKGHGWWEIDLDSATNKQLASGGIVQGRPGSTRLQMGAANQDLIKAIAAFGGGAYLGSMFSDPGEKGWGAATGAAVVGLAALARSRNKGVAEFAEGVGRRAMDVLGNVSREMRQMSEPLTRRLTNHELSFLRNSHDRLQAIVPFVDELKALPKSVRKKLDEAILTGTRADFYRALSGHASSKMMHELGKAMRLRTQLEVELIAAGKLQGPAGDFPRIVTDPEGLIKHLAGKAGGNLAKIVDEANQKAVRETGEGMSPFDISNFINSVLARQGKLPVALARDLQPFYASAAESLPLWIRAAQREVDRIRFFGPDAVVSKNTGVLNLHQSIQNVIGKEVAAGRIDGLQMDRMRQLLWARFGRGEHASGPATQGYKNFVYTALLANPLAAATQLSDVAAAAAIHGFMPTLKGVQAMATRDPSRWTLADVGLVNHLADEFVSTTRKTPHIAGIPINGAKIIDKALKYSGFSAVDELGKLTQMNAAAQKFQGLAKSQTGQAKIAQRYGAYFDQDLPQLINDLRANRKSPLVAELIFRELSDVQPISKLEMPAAYLNNPKLRAAWTLKTFMIKQINLAMDRGIGEIRKGNRMEGLGFLLRYGLVLGAAGAGVDFLKNMMMGRRDDLDWGNIPENVFKTFGWSQYVIDKAKKGDILEAVGSIAIPPWKLFQDIIKQDPKAMQYVPFVGKLWYNWMMGGNKDADASRAERERRQEREAEGDSAFRREEADERRQRRRERRWERSE